MGAILPVSSPSSHPLIPWPVPPPTPPRARQQCPWANWLAGWLLGSCVKVRVVPAVSFCVERVGPSRSQVHAHPSKWSWDEALVSLDFRYLKCSSVRSQTCLPSLPFWVKNKREYVSPLFLPSPHGWPVLILSLDFSDPWRARAKAVLFPLHGQAGYLRVTKGKVYVTRIRVGKGRTTLRRQKLCALFYLLPCLLIYLFMKYVFIIQQKIYSHLWSTQSQNLSSWPHGAQWIIPLLNDRKQGGKFSPSAQTPPPQADFNQKWG